MLLFFCYKNNKNQTKPRLAAIHLQKINHLDLFIKHLPV
jgi:hypothetical protein